MGSEVCAAMRSVILGENVFTENEKNGKKAPVFSGLKLKKSSYAFYTLLMC